MAPATLGWSPRRRRLNGDGAEAEEAGDATEPVVDLTEEIEQRQSKVLESEKQRLRLPLRNIY